MSRAGGAFNFRAFVALVTMVSGLVLPVTGIANHLCAFQPLAMERHLWMSAHNAFGLLFVVFVVWHCVLNRRALWNHVKGAAARGTVSSREALLAGAVLSLAVFFVFHAFLVGGRP